VFAQNTQSVKSVGSTSQIYPNKVKHTLHIPLWVL